MSKSTILLLSAAFTSFPAFALDTAAWRHQQGFNVSASGITRLELPAETLNASRTQLEDARLIAPSGAEVPFIIERASLTPPREAAVRTFKSSLTESSTVLDLETGSADAMEAVSFDSPAANFIKAARLEGSNDGALWNELAANEVVFRQSNGIGRMRIPFASASYARLRITFDDKRSPPVPFTAARVEFTRHQAATVSHEVSISQTDEKTRATELTVNLGAANLHLSRLRLAVSDPVFSRRVTVSYMRDDNGKKQSVPVSSAVIYRVTTNDGLSTAGLDVPIHRQVPAAQLTLTIENGDSPPLHVSGIEAARLPVSLVFFAQEHGPWKLLTGNSTCAAPSYDLASLDRQLRQGNATKLTPTALAANPDYKAQPALPNVTPQGAEIDLAKWRYRKPIAVKETGVIRVEFDVEVLAHAQSTLGDLRVIQGGKQIPWQLDPTKATRIMQPAVSKESDPKRRSVSLWRITLPIGGLPALRLTGTSPTALFERSISAWSSSKNSMGNEYKTPLGSTQWRHQDGSSQQDLGISFHSMRLPETFFIETDNGDNPPIEIENVKVEYPVVTLAAKLTESEPAFLYYGNDRASMPSYDLRLVRQELLSAARQSVALGAEEKLAADKRANTGDVSAGSPWLWASLALVIGALLWVVTKMLPKAQSLTLGLLALLTSCTASLLHADDKDADAFFREGVAMFYQAKPRESVAAFDKVIEIAPNAAPQLWQRGLSLYYTGDYAAGRKQFELHQTVNPHDVENAAWHFICVARAENLEAARKALITIEGDARVPMKEVHDLFAGKGTEEAVLQAASNQDAGDEALRNQRCYAHLYLGLYHEALGHADQAKEHMLKAAIDYKMDHYMGKTAQVHVKLRGWVK